MQRLLSWTLIFLVVITLIACGNEQSKSSSEKPNATPADNGSSSSPEPTQPKSTVAPSKFVQVVGAYGTIDVEVFDKWVIVYTYPTEEHKRLGVASTAKVHENIGTQSSPKLGELIAEAKLSSPTTFKNPFQTPAEIEIEETHLRGGKNTYSGKMIFQWLGREVSRKRTETAIGGQKLEQYFSSWPMYNYVIEKRLSRGQGGVFTIVLNPEGEE